MAQRNFFNYPTPKEAPLDDFHDEYRAFPLNNPVFTGRLLAFLSHIVSRIPYLQRFFWINAQFTDLRNLKALDGYTPVFSPAVVPFSNDPEPSEQLTIPTKDTGKAIYYSSADYIRAYETYATTPLRVAHYLLDLIKQEPHKSAFIGINRELVLAAAQASTERYKHGNTLGPLDGVPFACKDEFDIEGYHKTFGSTKSYGFPECQTAWCVRKIEDAGAVLIGKTTMHEFGTDTTNNNPIATPRNPCNKSYYTGGSSGGSAYCVGAGLVPFAIGADGGGSIRLPSAYCNAIGLKPSAGRVSIEPTPGLTSNGVAGPIAATLEDIAIVYRVMAKPDEDNMISRSFPKPYNELTQFIRPEQRVLAVYRPWFEDCNPCVRKYTSLALNELSSTYGYRVVELPRFPFLLEARLGHTISIISDISAYVKGDFSNLNPANKVLLSIASQSWTYDYIMANKMRSLIMSHFSYLWEKYPGMILVTPTTPEPGVQIKDNELSHGVSDGNGSITSMRFVFLANFCGAPAISVGVGYDDDSNMPCSLMGMAQWGKEEQLFSWADDVRKVSNRRRGEVWVDVLGNAVGNSV